MSRIYRTLTGKLLPPDVLSDLRLQYGLDNIEFIMNHDEPQRRIDQLLESDSRLNKLLENKNLDIVILINEMMKIINSKIELVNNLHLDSLKG